MNKINIPGFIAEASIPISRGHFRTDDLAATTLASQTIIMADECCGGGYRCIGCQQMDCTSHCTDQWWWLGTWCADYCRYPDGTRRQISPVYGCGGPGEHPNYQLC